MKLVRLLLFLINIAAAISLGVSLLAPYVNPKDFWLPSIFGLAFAPLFILNVLFTIFWAAQLKLRAFLSGIMIFLSMTSLGKVVNFSNNEGTASSNSVRLISHNARGMQDSKQKRIDTEQYIDELNSEMPDIICFQEYNDWFYSKNKANSSEVKRQLQMKLYGHSRFRELYRALVIATKLPVVHSKSKYFSENSSNGVMYADVVMPNDDTIRVINFHLESIGLSKKEALQLNDLEQMQEKAVVKSKNLMKRLRNAFVNRADQIIILKEWIQDSPHAVVICGDMNDTPVSYAYQQISTGLQDAFLMKGSFLGTSYNGPWPSYRIDYFFTDPALKVNSYKSLDNFHSDHKAILISIN